MPSNHELVRARLGKLGLGAHREDEIVCELADHIADHAAALEACGVVRDAALRAALNDVSDWPAVRHEIVSAETGEGNMNYRTKVLWLPALGSLTLSSVLLATLQFFGLVPRFYWLSKSMTAGPYFTIYIPWLVVLPIVGAAVALWSQRAGGRTVHRLLAALAPAIGVLGTFLLIPLLSLSIYMFLRLFRIWHGPSPYADMHAFQGSLWIGTGAILGSWVLFPAVGLLIGAAPFLRKTSARA